MLAAVPTVSVPESTAPEGVAAIVARGPSAAEVFAETGLERVLVAGESLIRAGERKSHVYRVKEGLVCTYWQAPGEAGRRIVGFSFIGDIVGLGVLDRHVTSVEAGADTIVQCLQLDETGPLLETDETFKARNAQAAAVELQLLKQSLVAQGRAETMVRVAALLSVLSSNNVNEGRSPEVITDDITCGFVAETLGLGVGALEAALVGLSEQGLIEALPTGGLRLRDRQGLERLAEARA